MGHQIRNRTSSQASAVFSFGFSSVLLCEVTNRFLDVGNRFHYGFEIDEVVGVTASRIANRNDHFATDCVGRWIQPRRLSELLTVDFPVSISKFA